MVGLEVPHGERGVSEWPWGLERWHCWVAEHLCWSAWELGKWRQARMQLRETCCPHAHGSEGQEHSMHEGSLLPGLRVVKVTSLLSGDHMA